ncbi:hypothetical protein [Anaeromyxobacter terrae]|nr:hypothetical protein [Anaeromyxobacter sp. SG22]
MNEIKTTELTVKRTIPATPAQDDEMGRMHAEGWGYVLGAIADRFVKR